MAGWIQDRRTEGRGWTARYWVNDRVVSKSFERKVDAERWLTEEVAKLNRGEWIDPRAGAIPYLDWAKSWLAGHGHNVKPKTLAGYESLLRSRVLPVFARTELNRITPESVRRWVADMATEGLSPARIRQAHQVLSASLEVAVDDGLIARNPCAKVKLPQVRKRRQLFLTASQVASLAFTADAQREGAGTLIQFLAYSGLRWGEATALRVSNVDTTRRRVRVTEAYSEVRGKLILGSTKTHEARTVIVPSFVAQALETHLAANNHTDRLMFAAPGGGPLRSSNFRRDVWLPAVESARDVPDGLLVHDLRDTAASLAISAGASIKAVQRMLGHASAAMTLDTYGSLFEDDLEDLADRMSAKYGSVVAASNVVSLPRGGA